MDKKSLDIIVEEFFDTGKLVLNEELDENGRSPKIGRLINEIIAEFNNWKLIAEIDERTDIKKQMHEFDLDYEIVKDLNNKQRFLEISNPPHPKSHSPQ